ncbi:unnamed protein product, partial [Cylicostephanus goldi]
MHIQSWLDCGADSSAYLSTAFAGSVLFDIFLIYGNQLAYSRQGWTQRNLALQYIRENYSPETDAVLYFADDDYSYDVRLFDQYIRN